MLPIAITAGVLWVNVEDAQRIRETEVPKAFAECGADGDIVEQAGFARSGFANQERHAPPVDAEPERSEGLGRRYLPRVDQTLTERIGILPVAVHHRHRQTNAGCSEPLHRS